MLSESHISAQDLQPVPEADDTYLVSKYSVNLKPRRIVIVTTNNRQDRLREQDMFAKALSAKLRKCGLQFETVISPDKVCRDKLPTRRGRFDEVELVALSHNYNADAVLYCELEIISAYNPMQMETSLLLVNVGEAIAIVSANHEFDLNRPDTYEAYSNFALQSPDHSQNLMNSPSKLINYAASTVVDSLASVWKK